MSSNISFCFFVGIALIFALFVTGAFGHSYLTSPISRSNQKQTNTGCRGPACLGPCDIPRSQTTRAPITIQRGASINAQWPRNNHAGGFIRFAWAATSQSDSASSFDAGVSQVFCHEIGGCGPSNPADPNGGDTNPADGSVNPCQTTITVPLSLPDGQYTLQWAWFGGAFALGDYYSCVDYTISGGPTGSAVAATFHGGDYSNPGSNVCKFFNTDRLHQCVNEPCDHPIYPLSQQETGPAFGIASSSGTIPSSSSSSSSTTHKPASTSTSTSTTARPASSSSSSSSTSTSTSSSSTSCVTGNMQCVASNSYRTCAHSVWGPTQPCATGTSCHPSGNYIYCY